MTTASATSYALELRGVHQTFGHAHVLRGIDLVVRAGERIALIGPNGAGKSTLFHVLSGQLVPSRGEIRLHGQRIDGKKPFEINRLGLSRSFQISSLFPTLSVAHNMRCALLWSLGYRYSFWRLVSRLDDVNARVDDLLMQLELYPERNTPAMHLSYAQQRALEIGIAIAGAGAGNSTVILLDEPTAGMSASETLRCTQLIKKVTQGRTLLTVEHDMGVVFNLADKIAVLAQGQIIAFDTPQNVRANPHVQHVYLGC